MKDQFGREIVKSKPASPEKEKVKKDIEDFKKIIQDAPVVDLTEK